MAKRKPKKCKFSECGEMFIPYQTTQVVCSGSIVCALGYAEEKKAKKFKTETREMKREFRAKDRSYQIKKAQEAFNAFIRKRDENLPCVSCNRYHQGQVHCGHYKTIGSHPELRFEPLNCAAQCAPCNNHLSGNIIEYRKGLLERIGRKNLYWLEGTHKPKHYTIDDLISIKETYRDKLKQLQETL